MSYCRFSSDDFRCDVYVYENVHGGWYTHVAGSKSRGYIPRTLPWPTFADKGSPNLFRRWRFELWFWAYVLSERLQRWYLRHAPRRDLGLPHDCETFVDGTATLCAWRLESLRKLGYRVPQYAIDALLAEGNEASNATGTVDWNATREAV